MLKVPENKGFCHVLPLRTQGEHGTNEAGPKLLVAATTPEHSQPDKEVGMPDNSGTIAERDSASNSHQAKDCWKQAGVA